VVLLIGCDTPSLIFQMGTGLGVAIILHSHILSKGRILNNRIAVANTFLAHSYKYIFALAFSRSSSPFTITTSHALVIACASRPNANVTTSLGSCGFSATLTTSAAYVPRRNAMSCACEYCASVDVSISEAGGRGMGCGFFRPMEASRRCAYWRYAFERLHSVPVECVVVDAIEKT